MYIYFKNYWRYTFKVDLNVLHKLHMYLKVLISSIYPAVESKQTEVAIVAESGLHEQGNRTSVSPHQSYNLTETTPTTTSQKLIDHVCINCRDVYVLHVSDFCTDKVNYTKYII